MVIRKLNVWVIALLFFVLNVDVISANDLILNSPEELTPLYYDGNGKVSKKTPFYIGNSTGLVEVGTLEPGTVFSPARVTENYFIVKGIEYTFYIPKSAMISTDEKPTSHQLTKKSVGAKLVASTNAAFIDEDGKRLGEIVKGQEIKLASIKHAYGVINLLGRQVYIDLSDFQHVNLVNPKKNISYKEMSFMLQILSRLYPEFLQLKEIGKSVEGRTLYAVKLGKGDKEILLDGSIHAREHMTTNLLLEMIDQYSKAYDTGSNFEGFNVNELLNQVSIWFVPMVNPDGVTLVQTRENVSPEVLMINNGRMNFNHWKANIRGVDLNRNFDGGWMTSQSTKYPAYKDFKGTRAFSEPESKHLRDFIAQLNIKTYISYHSSGSILYYYHHQKGENLERDLRLARKLSNVTGYKVMPPTGDVGSGASADWFIMTYKLPGITIEIAPPIHESVVPLKYWDSIWEKNKTVGLVGAEEASKR
ncbi:M14 family metallocarboxypeptidase [Ureibacillus massiliensis]|uniref:M14 family metallopeptidase n=1 Tax=Ureibacillus massiliensis TaxID=292806 RepID=UPI00068E3643|nr:M14 family metallocarboxypeptidase [Ureibacillus massiliensis]